MIGLGSCWALELRSRVLRLLIGLVFRIVVYITGLPGDHASCVIAKHCTSAAPFFNVCMCTLNAFSNNGYVVRSILYPLP